MPTDPRVPWWIRPCAGGRAYPTRDGAAAIGPAFWCAECAAWHARPAPIDPEPPAADPDPADGRA